VGWSDTIVRAWDPDFVDDVHDCYDEMLGDAGRERYRGLAEAARERSADPQL
jgi:hypothetical protein